MLPSVMFVKDTQSPSCVNHKITPSCLADRYLTLNLGEVCMILLKLDSGCYWGSTAVHSRSQVTSLCSVNFLMLLVVSHLGVLLYLTHNNIITPYHAANKKQICDQHVQSRKPLRKPSKCLHKSCMRLSKTPELS